VSLLPAFPAERVSAPAQDVVRSNVVLHFDAVVTAFLRAPADLLVVVGVGLVVELVVVLYDRLLAGCKKILRKLRVRNFQGAANLRASCSNALRVAFRNLLQQVVLPALFAELVSAVKRIFLAIEKIEANVTNAFVHSFF